MPKNTHTHRQTHTDTQAHEGSRGKQHNNGAVTGGGVSIRVAAEKVATLGKFDSDTSCCSRPSHTHTHSHTHGDTNAASARRP